MEQRITAPKGCKIDSVERDNNSVIIMFSEDKPKFNKGDFLKSGNFGVMVIYKSKEENKNNTFEVYYNNSHESNKDWSVGAFRLCTDKEKQEMLDYMHSNGKDWDEDNMEVIPYVWKPQRGEKYWLIHTNFEVRFSFYDPNNGSCFDDIKYYNRFKTEKEAQKYAEEFKRILKERKL